MRFPQWTHGSSREGVQTRVLLANNNQRRSLTSATLRRLPTLYNTLKQTRGSSHANLSNMASPAMGNGPSRTIANSPRKPPLHGGRCRVLHQMDRSKATSYNNLTDCQKILLATNHMLLQSAKRTHSRQWNPFRQRSIQGVLYADRNKVVLRLYKTPSIQWSCRKSEWYNPPRHL